MSLIPISFCDSWDLLVFRNPNSLLVVLGNVISTWPRAGQANTFGIAPKVFKSASQNNHLSSARTYARPGILAGQRSRGYSFQDCRFDT